MNQKKFVLKGCVAMILLFSLGSIIDDVYPKDYVQRDHRGNLDFPENDSHLGNAECKELERERICFSTWKISGFDTGIGLVVLRYDIPRSGDTPSGFKSSFELLEMIFYRETDFSFVDRKNWSERDKDFKQVYPNI